MEINEAFLTGNAYCLPRNTYKGLEVDLDNAGYMLISVSDYYAQVIANKNSPLLTAQPLDLRNLTYTKEDYSTITSLISKYYEPYKGMVYYNLADLDNNGMPVDNEIMRLAQLKFINKGITGYDFKPEITRDDLLKLYQNGKTFDELPLCFDIEATTYKTNVKVACKEFSLSDLEQCFTFNQ